MGEGAVETVMRVLLQGGMLLLLLPGYVWGQAVSKRLIEFGWDRPTPALIRTHLSLAESRPFNGIVFRLAGGSRIFSTTPLDSASFAGDITELRATPFRRLTDNFALVQSVSDSNWDWMNDAHWRAAEQSIRLLARAAKQGGLRGIVFDYERYGTSPWSSNTGPPRSAVSLQQLQDVVRQRGRAFIQAIQEEYPGVTLLALFQLSFFDKVIAAPDSMWKQRLLLRSGYDLMIPFVEGMLEGIDSSTTLIDGNELAYWNDSSAEFLQGNMLIRQGVLPLLQPRYRGIYASRIQVGHSVFYDYIMNLYQRPGDPLPAQLSVPSRLDWLTHNVYYATQTADRYAWFYCEHVNWWQDSIPKDVQLAIKEGYDRAVEGDSLGFSMDSILDKARHRQ